MLLSLSLCNGGNACHCLNRSVYDFLAHGENGKASQPTIDDIPDQQTRDTLSKVQTSQTEGEFLSSIQQDDILDLLHACGYNAVPKFSGKDQLLGMIVKYILIDKPRSALEQFKEGLETLGILQAIQAYPDEFRNLFCFKATELTASLMESHFVTVFSPAGSNRREKEELIVMHWRDLLQECEGTIDPIFFLPIHVLDLHKNLAHLPVHSCRRSIRESQT